MEDITMVKVSELSRHPNNPRLGDIDVIVDSIRRNGWYGTLVAQRSTGYVLAGNHRLQAAQRVGIESVPVYWVDVDDATATRILLADNKTSDNAIYDDQQLVDLLMTVSNDDDLLGTGWDADELEALVKMFSDNEDDDDWRPDTETDPVDLESEYHLLIVFDNEHEQREALKQLTEQGYQVKASLL
jgi:hypothetical protein